MSLTSGFYNSINGDRKYNALEMSSLFNGIINDGVFMNIGDALMVKASSGNTITVGTGRAWFNSTWTNNDALYPIEATEAEVVLDRIDAVVLEINNQEETRANLLKIVAGTPGTSPDKPVFVDTDYVHYHVLAYITRPAGSETITQANIENNIGSNAVPFITGILSTISAEELVTQWETEFSEWMFGEEVSFDNWSTTQKALFVEWSTGQMEDVEAWLLELHNVLDSETATHLQLEIDDIYEKLENTTGAKEKTWAEYQALPEEQKVDGTLWVITDRPSNAYIPGSSIKINPTGTDLVSFESQAAIIELANRSYLVKATLTAGETELIINNDHITSAEIIKPYTSVYGVSPKAITIETGKAILTFDSRTADMVVGLEIRKEGN